MVYEVIPDLWVVRLFPSQWQLVTNAVSEGERFGVPGKGEEKETPSAYGPQKAAFMAAYSLPALWAGPPDAEALRPSPIVPRKMNAYRSNRIRSPGREAGNLLWSQLCHQLGRDSERVACLLWASLLRLWVRGHREGLEGRAWLLDSDSNLSLASPLTGHFAHSSPSRPSGSVHVCLTYFPSEKLARCSI